MPPTQIELAAFLFYYSSSRMMSNLFMVVTITPRSGVKPKLSSQRPLSLMTGTVVWLQRLMLMVTAKVRVSRTFMVTERRREKE